MEEEADRSHGSEEHPGADGQDHFLREIMSAVAEMRECVKSDFNRANKESRNRYIERRLKSVEDCLKVMHGEYLKAREHAERISSVEKGFNRLARKNFGADLVREVKAEVAQAVATMKENAKKVMEEPYVDRLGRIPGFGMGARVVIGGDGANPWTAVVVMNTEVEVFRLASLSDSHCVVVQAVKGGRSVYLVSLYCQNSHEIEGYLDKLQSILEVLRNKEVLIGMDRNARNPRWGDRVLNERGEMMEEFLETRALVFLNDGRTPTYLSGRGESHIDLTAVTRSLVKKAKNWKVETQWTSSFHRVLRYDIGDGENERKKRKEYCRFSLRSANWDLFRTKLEETKLPLLTYALNGRCSTAKYEGMVTRWLLKATEASMRRGVRRAALVMWWTPDLETLKRQMVQARRKVGKERNDRDIRAILQAEYRDCRSRYKKMIKEQKEKSWEAFVKDELAKGPWNYLYKTAVGKIKMERVKDVIGEEEGVVEWKESARRLLQSLVKDDDRTAESREHAEIREEVRTYSSGEREGWELELQEVRNAVWACKNGKAPGWDGISAEMLKEGWD